jgi:hypothetical protein
LRRLSFVGLAYGLAPQNGEDAPQARAFVVKQNEISIVEQISTMPAKRMHRANVAAAVVAIESFLKSNSTL